MTTERSPARASREIAAALHGYIVQHGITQEQLAEAVGYTPPYMSARMTGKVAMTTDVIDAAARLSGVSFEQMIWILLARVAEKSDSATRHVEEAIKRDDAAAASAAKAAAAAKSPSARRRGRRTK